MFRYAQINENGIVVSESYLSGEVIANNMIPIGEGFLLTNKKYVEGEWVEYVPELFTEILTEQEKSILEMAVNVDYLVCLADMGL